MRSRSFRPRSRFADVARLALALPLALESDLAEQAERHGHEIVARAASAAEAASLVVSLKPDARVVASEPRYLGERVLAACDDSGGRVVALTTGDADRRLAASLGLF